MKQYNAPTYTGYKTICELIGLSKRYGNIWVPTGEEMNFNSEGYAFVPPTPREQRLLIIDKSPNGTLEAYAWNYGHYRKLLNFTDSGHAQDIINDIYTNPYYHAASYYTDKIDCLVKGLDLTQFSSVEDMRTHLVYLHERGMSPSVEYTTDYINQLNACIHEPNELRDKFAELFKKLYADNGMVEKVNNTSTLFDSLPSV